MSNFPTLRTGPIPTPGMVFQAFWGWMRSHRKSRWFIAVAAYFALCTILTVLKAEPANAVGESSAQTFFLPLVGITDSQGVPIWRYLDLPFDPGGATHAARMIRSVIAQLLWVGYAFPILLVIALLNFVLEFEWLTWVAQPFITISDGVTNMLDTWAIVTLGITVSCAIIAYGFVRGKMGAATVEAVMVIIIIGVWASPLANPIEYLKGDGTSVTGNESLIDQSADFGQEMGNYAINPDDEVASPTLSSSVIDLTLRNPLLTMTFGSPFTDEAEKKCSDEWNKQAKELKNDAEDIRKKVLKCSDAAADGNQTDSYNWLVHYFMAIPAAIGVLCLIIVFLAFLIYQVIQVLITSVISTIRAYFALFSGAARQAWFNSIAQVFIHMVLIGVFIFMLNIYMWAMTEIMKLIPPGSTQIASVIIGIIVITMVITFWRMKKAGKSIGEKIAKAFGKNGMHANAEMKPSKFKAAAGSTLKAGLSKGMDMYRDNKNFRRMANLAQGGAALATGGATGAITATATTIAKRRAMSGVAAKATSAFAGRTANGMGGTAANAARTAGAAGRPRPKAVPRAAIGSGTPERTNGGIPMPSSSTVDDVRPMTSASTQGESPEVQGTPQPMQGTISDPSRYERILEPDAIYSPHEVAEQQSAQPMSAEYRAENLTPGRYGHTWVHSDGTITSPVVPATTGSPLQTIPEEPKMAQAMQNGDSWIMSAQQNSYEGYSAVEEEVFTTTSTKYQPPAPMNPAAPMVKSRKRDKAMNVVTVGMSAAKGGAEGAKNAQKPAPTPKPAPARKGFWGFGKKAPKSDNKSAYSSPKDQASKPKNAPVKRPAMKAPEQNPQASRPNQSNLKPVIPAPKATGPTQPNPKPVGPAPKVAGPAQPSSKHAASAPEPPRPSKPATQPRPNKGFGNHPGGNN